MIPLHKMVHNDYGCNFSHFRSLDNSNLQPCPMDMESKESCTMNSNDGNIYSMTRIAILNITNMRYNVYRKFRKDFNTRDISKYTGKPRYLEHLYIEYYAYIEVSFL